MERDPYGKTKAPYTNASVFPHLAHGSPDAPAQSALLGASPPLSPGSPTGGGDPEVLGTRAQGGGRLRQGLWAVSPGDEEDDAQRVGGDGEDVESERGPEGDEGATEEHGRRHDDRRSQSREPEGTEELRAPS